ncbi:LysR family transcriptional regulator ArgP [Brucella sp. BE17]|uniref:LysR family transcriptional regulator ArgP n=1 Tax=Brucella sp. BE17 TaxID=3142977 RepID=UPI0031B9DFF6
MIDYPALKALAMVVQTGSFEKAARMLNVTPSAISQRVKNLEERLGVVLVSRGNPCLATDKGEWLCRHIEQVGMLERELLAELPALAPHNTERAQVTLHIATNADSLGTWFIKAISGFTRETDYLVNIAVDDQDHTAEWLQHGRVLAAVTALSKPVQGCRVVPLGALRYKATASPDFMTRFFPQGLTKLALSEAPMLTFNQKDRLQERWIKQNLKADIVCPTHWLPSTQSFIDASLEGMGWGMNPDMLVDEHIAHGRLIELIPDTALVVPLYWQVNRLAADRLASLSAHVTAAARRSLFQPPS